MVADNSRLPDLYPQHELFLCDIGDVAIKDDMGSMEHPVFSLSKRKDTATRFYENGNRWLKVVPSHEYGSATIWDKDLLIFAVSQLMAAKKQGREITADDRRLQFWPNDFFVFANRHNGGQAYRELEKALDRLKHTNLTTNVTTGGLELREGAGLIDSYRLIKSASNQRVIAWEIVLSEWLIRAVVANEVLTLDRGYFRLRSSLERRIYEIARKHCGQQSCWAIGLDKLQLKTGSQQAARKFRYALQAMADDDTLPEYRLSIDGNIVRVENREYAQRLEAAANETAAIKLDPDTYHDARSIADGWDIYQLEQEWREWMTMGGMDAPANPDKAFIGFCLKWVERRKTA